MPRPLSQFLYLLMVCLFCLSSLQAQAQTSLTPQPRASGQVASAKTAGGPCLIAEFRLMALTTHDPQERQKQVDRVAPTKQRQLFPLAIVNPAFQQSRFDGHLRQHGAFRRV